MKIYGTVMDESEQPLADATIRFLVGDTERSSAQSDRNGVYRWIKELDDHVGQTLTFVVEKEAYKTARVEHVIGRDDIKKNIELVPVRETAPIELMVNVKDEKKAPIEKAKISLTVDNKKAGSGISDSTGNWSIKLGADAKDKTVDCEAKRFGYKMDPSTKTVDLAKSTTHVAVLKKLFWYQIPQIVAAGIAAVIILLLGVYAFWPRFNVTEVAVAPDINRHVGACPVTISFKGQITASGKGSVKYRFIDSQGVQGTEEILDFESGGTKAVRTNKLRLYSSFKGWQGVQVYSPKAITSEPAYFEVNCEPPIPK